jgi:putative membrane protein
MAAPVYVFTGFLDSGKTTLIKDTLSDPQFMEGVTRTLIICFEQGETEYDEKWLDEHHCFIEYIDDADTFNEEKMKELDTIYHPAQVFIEWNGTLALPDQILSGMPDFWPLVQILTPVDASTFQTFMGPLRQMMYEQLRYSDTVICNRCTPDTSGTMLRGNIKAINRRAQIYYEGSFGEPVELKDGGLPFDINAPVIDIKDDDYGIFYMDAAENPQKYAGKEVILRGYYADNIPGYKQTFILGRQAMVCCANDTSLCGITVTGVKIWEMKKGDWIEVQGKLKPVPVDNGGETVVLYADRVARYHKPAEEFVTFS